MMKKPRYCKWWWRSL